mgnify:CR=1 FL=1
MSERKFTPFVPAHVTQSEFTLRALLIGLGMCVVLGAANAYLGLRAGMTIARRTRRPSSAWRCCASAAGIQ